MLCISSLPHLTEGEVLYAPCSKNLKSALINSLFFLTHVCPILILPMVKLIYFFQQHSLIQEFLTVCSWLCGPPLHVYRGTFLQKAYAAFINFSVGPGVLKQSRHVAIHQFLFHAHKCPGKFTRTLLWPLKSLLSFSIHLFSEVITCLFSKTHPRRLTGLSQMGDLNYKIVHS